MKAVGEVRPCARVTLRWWQICVFGAPAALEAALACVTAAACLREALAPAQPAVTGAVRDPTPRGGPGVTTAAQAQLAGYTAWRPR